MPLTPKVELHLHLEGGAPPEFIRRLADEKRQAIPAIFDAAGGYSFRDFADFLRVYEAACTVLASPTDFARLTTAVLEQSAASGVVYTEIFLSPDFCGGRDLSAWRDYLHAIVDAADKAERELGITMRGIVTCIRHFGPDAAKESALCAAETAGDFIVGFGMAGDETRGRPRDFTWAFDLAREAGLGLTCHAGEWAGPVSVRETLEDLRVSRIGHGVRAVEDAALLTRLAQEGVVLEVCPGSNIALGLYRDWGAHPVRTLRDAGVQVTISTDDPPFFHTTMAWEYDRLADAFGWGETDFAALNRIAARAAFCDEVTREKIMKKLEPAE